MMAWLEMAVLLLAGGVSAKEQFNGADIIKPRFHLTASEMWMNDPNGMLQFKGHVHVFYQLNPNSIKWDSPSWGHVVSTDLAHWTRLPVALAPDAPYDADGVFSGSASILGDGTPAMLYTGVSQLAKYGYRYAVQALAVAADPNDPLLVNWTKHAANPVIAEPLAPGSNHDQWRDPTTAWVQMEASPDNKTDALVPTYWVAVGAMTDSEGGALMYSSADMVHWNYRGVLYAQRAEAVARNASGAVNLFPQQSIWECPDFFSLNNGTVTVFKYSDINNLRQPYGQDWFIVSNSPVNYSNALSSNGAGAHAFSGTYNGTEFVPRLWDYGSVYASKTFTLEDGRRVWIGWVYETSEGCKQFCGDGTPITEQQGWQGAQTLLREVTVDAATGDLILLPLPELQLLRGDLLLNASATLVPVAGASQGTQIPLLLPPTNGSSHFEATLHFSANPGIQERCKAFEARTVTLKTVLSTLHGAEAEISLLATVACSAEGAWFVEKQGEIHVNTTGVGGATQAAAALQGGPLSLQEGPLDTFSVDVQVFVDGSVMEVYAAGGRARVTSRLYPSGPPSSQKWGMRAEVSNSREAWHVAAQGWEMNDCFADALLGEGFAAKNGNNVARA